MTEYIFRFGYVSPEEHASNSTVGTDFESSDFFRILAASEEEALRWGQELVERYVQRLFGDANKSWKAEQFASWIEHEPDAALEEAARQRPLVKVGEYPDFETMARATGDLGP